MADQLVQRPGVERLVPGLVGQQIVRAQSLQAVRQLDRAGWDCGLLSFDNDHIEQLTGQRQLLFQLDPPTAVGKQVGEADAE
jgi:hypothetical protein